MVVTQFLTDFWATVSEAVRPMLSDRCLSVLSVTLVYCGQTVGWMKITLGMEVGLGPCRIVLDGDAAHTLGTGIAPHNFRPMYVVAERLDASKCHLVARCPGDIVLDEDLALPKGYSPQFSAHVC